MAPKTNLYYKANRALALPPFKFRRANPTSDPSLDFYLFPSRKREKPFGGQPRQAKRSGKTASSKTTPPYGYPSNGVELQTPPAIATLHA